MRRCFVSVLFLILLSLPAVAGAQVPTEAERQAQIRRLLIDYRGSRNDAGRRVRAIRAMVALGPDGVAAAGQLLENEVERLGRPLGDPLPTAAIDARIEELRKILADLRAEPELTKKRLQTAGLPALDELSLLWRRREGMLQTHYGRLARVREQIELLLAFLRQYQAESEGSALPVAPYVAQAEELLAQASKPEDPDVRSVLEENAKTAVQIDPREVAGMQALDAMRIMCGLNPLLYDMKLSEAARGHCADMDSGGFFSHDSPVPGKATPWDRAKLAGTTASGENIYMGSGSPVDALKAWFLSPGHHKNMLNESNTRQGLGRVGRYWTQLFGR